MRSDAVATAAAAAAASFSPMAKAVVPQPVALNASDWLGIDGNWSTYAFLVGNNNPVNVLFSTSISEFWAVAPGGCSNQKNLSECVAKRGGIYKPSDSKHWSGLGIWQLGLPGLGTGGSGQYGFDTIAAYSPIRNIGFGMSNVLMSAISSTDYYLGFFGVGLRSGNFGDIVASPPLRQAVSSYGWIPSYSYGYTAGASYRGIVGSATLGGYDAARFIPHDETFAMNQAEGVPRPRVRGIEISAKNGSVSADWSYGTRILMPYNKTFTALIDTTTPYLWLPRSVSDEFANALNMTYNNTFGLYTLTSKQYLQYSASDSPLSFTFSLSSKDNNDNYGQSLDVQGIVNITLPIRSFVSLLEYPFMNATVRSGEPSVPYFALRRAADETFIIGNAFMQEAYLITQYDTATFSIHQAKFPSDPIGDAQLHEIKQPPGSTLPPPVNPNAGNGLSTGEMAGIAVGVVAFVSVLLLAFFCYRHHRRQQRDGAQDEFHDCKDTSSTLTPDSPESSITRIFSKIVGCRRSPPRIADKMIIRGVNASEAPDCQIYELPAPVLPAELDAGVDGDDHSILGESDLGTDSTQHSTAYELARRKLDRQLQGPVPEYTPSADVSMLPQEKMSILEIVPLEQSHAISDQHPSPITPTPIRAESTGYNFIPEPSPVSSRGDWSSAELPSPVTASMPARSNSFRTRSRGYSTESRPLSVNSHLPPSPSTDATLHITASFQKTPIDPSRVVCLGPLPENVQLPGQRIGTESRLVATDDYNLSTGMLAPGYCASVGSQGSNLTNEVEGAAEKVLQQDSVAGRNTNQAQQLVMVNLIAKERPPLPTQVEEREEDGQSSHSKTSNLENSSESGYIDPGRDLVHVPQMAEKRYSWEDVGPQQRMKANI